MSLWLQSVTEVLEHTSRRIVTSRSGGRSLRRPGRRDPRDRGLVHFQPRPDVDPASVRFLQGLDLGPMAPAGRGSGAPADAPGPVEGQGSVGGETERPVGSVAEIAVAVVICPSYGIPLNLKNERRWFGIGYVSARNRIIVANNTPG
jgi:hypothetical protein